MQKQVVVGTHFFSNGRDGRQQFLFCSRAVDLHLVRGVVARPISHRRRDLLPGRVVVIERSVKAEDGDIGGRDPVQVHQYPVEKFDVIDMSVHRSAGVEDGIPARRALKIKPRRKVKERILRQRRRGHGGSLVKQFESCAEIEGRRKQCW